MGGRLRDLANVNALKNHGLFAILLGVIGRLCSVILAVSEALPGIMGNRNNVIYFGGTGKHKSKMRGTGEQM